MITIANPGKVARLAAATLFALALSACGQQGTTAADNAGSSEQPAVADTTMEQEMITELQIIDVEPGDGATAAAGQDVVVHYTGWLYDPAAPENKGSKFDSSVDRGQPFVFPLGGGRVISGWDEGVAGMQVGGKRVLIIPPAMAYGERGAGGAIPPNATLVFEVELLDVQ